MRLRGETLGEAGKLFRVSQQAGIHKVEDGPEIAEPVLHRRTSERQSGPGLELFDGTGLLGIGILDGLRFIEHGQSPGIFGDPRDTEQGTVAGDDHIGSLQLFGLQGLQLSGGQRGRVCDERFQSRSEALDFRRPIREQRCRGDQYAWFRLRIFLSLENEQKREHLDGFAESHIVGKASSESEFREEVEPAHTDLLIGTKDAFEILAGVYLRQSLRTAQAFQHFREPGSRTHLRPVGIFGGNIFGSNICAGQQAHGFAESQAVVLRSPLHLTEALDQAFEVLAVELNPASSNEGEAFRFL